MFINNFDPIAFQVFSLEIRWYSLAYIFGLIFGWMYCKKILIENQKIKKLFDDYVVYLILGIIIGGRLGYVFIYNPFYFLQNFHEIPMLWNGGMSFFSESNFTLSINIFCPFQGVKRPGISIINLFLSISFSLENFSIFIGKIFCGLK